MEVQSGLGQGKLKQPGLISTACWQMCLAEHRVKAGSLTSKHAPCTEGVVPYASRMSSLIHDISVVLQRHSCECPLELLPAGVLLLGNVASAPLHGLHSREQDVSFQALAVYDYCLPIAMWNFQSAYAAGPRL